MLPKFFFKIQTWFFSPNPRPFAFQCSVSREKAYLFENHVKKLLVEPKNRVFELKKCINEIKNIKIICSFCNLCHIKHSKTLKFFSLENQKKRKKSICNSIFFRFFHKKMMNFSTKNDEKKLWSNVVEAFLSYSKIIHKLRRTSFLFYKRIFDFIIERSTKKNIEDFRTL